MKRVEKIRLYPTRRQSERLRFVLDVTRQIYNALLEQRRWLWTTRRRRISTKEQYAEMTALRAEDDRIAAVYRECEDAALHRLDLAMQAFFRRIARGEAPGYPRFKPAARWKQISFPHGNRCIKLDKGQRRVIVPGVGALKLRRGGKISQTYGRVWLVERNERWYACFESEHEIKLLPKTGRVVGVDRGVKVLAVLDDDTWFSNPAVGERRRAATARLQRDLEALTERDVRGRVLNRFDAKRIKAAKRFARSKEREANARRDHLHKISREIVNGADTIALEKLHLRHMTRSAKGTLEAPGRNVRAKAGLNRRILDSGFGLLRQMIVSKAEEAARTVVEVDARYSSQTCSQCGHVAKENRRGRSFRCIRCGHLGHADVEAAREIRRRAESQLMREPHAGEEPATLHDAA